MEENRKFRNHISVVAEKVGGSVAALVVFAAAILFQNLDEVTRLSDTDLSAVMKNGGLILLAVAVLLVLMVWRQIFVWKKTWISLEENAIVVEVNTVNKKKNTIGISNISNINLEQNLFEMLFGTCKVKLDTNSRSTADKTDVKIILKKKDAEKLKQDILARMGRTAAGDRMIPDAMNASETAQEFDVRAGMGDILRHGFFSVNLFAVLVLLGGITGTVTAVMQLLEQPEFMKTLLSAAAAVLVAAGIIFSALWDTVKDFIRYYDFRAKREGNRIYIRYGFLKKVEYMIPVDKIQALMISQSFVARLSRRYMAEIINVGIGDEKEEKNSFLLLYMKRDQMEHCIHLLLPEFSGAVSQETEKQPVSVWAAWLIPLAVFAAVVCAAAAVFQTFLPQYGLWGWCAAGGLTVLVLFSLLLSYIAAGTGVGDEFLKISRGFFGRNFICMKYHNIQYMEVRQNILARAAGIRCAKVHLLASALHSEHSVPYFRGRKEEKIRKYMLQGERSGK